MPVRKLCLAAVLLCAVASVRFFASPQIEPLQLSIAPQQISADGYQTATVSVITRLAPRLSVVENSRGVAIGRPIQDAAGVWHAKVRGGVAPGSITIRAEADGAQPANATLSLTSSLNDREGDGMPDAVQLDADPDRAAFRRWFTFIAEAQFYQHPESRPAEINDCAALIRYAYRESLKQHDSAWVAAAKLPLALGLDSVSKYQYPFTLMRASLFRVKPGALKATDFDNGSFSQFADAQTLQTLNAHFVSRDIRRAEPGDLLFFRHDAADMPFHGMIYLGTSQIQDDGHRYLLYHTGPDDSGLGEIRRPSVDELMAHPNPSWRPVPGNPTFLGVYRWNILR